MGSLITYNNVSLGLTRTVKVEQKAEYDHSNTDVMFVGNRFNIRSVLTNIGGQSPATTMASIRHMLLQPRKAFLYQATDNNGVVDLLRVDAGGDGQALDADNGPKPVSCDIIQVSEGTWIIDYVIDVAVQDCTASQLFASNRFETTHDIDAKGYSTITTLGKVFVRSDMRKSPDALRWVVTPPLPKGFKRKSMYQIHEDGLSMLYRITDTEMYLAPPLNAVEATGRFTITAVPPGAILWAQCDVRLEGRKNMPKRQLMETAILIALRRLEAGGAARDPIKGKPWVEGGSVSEELYDNVVEVQLKGRILAGTTVLKEGDQYNLFYGFWTGFLGAAQGAFVPGQALAAGPLAANWSAKKIMSADLGTTLNSVRDSIADAIRRAKAAAGLAAGDKQSDDKIARPRGPGDKPGENGADKAPAAPFASFEGTLLDRFGALPEGSDQDGTVDPGLRGNLNFMTFVAAAFRDPCVADAALRNVPRPPVKGGGGGGQGVPVTVPIGNFATDGSEVSDDALWTAGDDAFNREQTAVLRSYGATAGGGFDYGVPNPSLDWRNQRLGRLRSQGPDGSVTMTTERALPEDAKPAPPDDPYPGWYESWYCEVEHDFDHYTVALPASKTNTPALSCKWANSLRTVRVRWAATKAMWPPEVPMVLNDTNTIMLRHKMTVPSVEISGDGKTPIFVVAGQTEYHVLDETYALVSYPVPPWLRLPMRAMPGPIPKPNIVLTGGAAGAQQDALNAALLNPEQLRPPGAGA
jgi:hypothetical protein